MTPRLQVFRDDEEVQVELYHRLINPHTGEAELNTFEVRHNGKRVGSWKDGVYYHFHPDYTHTLTEEES